MNKVIYISVALGLSLFVYLIFFTSEQSVANYPTGGNTIVAFGDSLVEGVGASEGNNFVSVLSGQINLPIENLGKSGDTTRDGLARLDRVLKNNPDVVILLLGGNDYLQKIPQEETFSNLATIIETIHASGAIVVLLGVRGGLLIDVYKKDFQSLAHTENTAYVPNVLDGLFANPKLMSDAIHPNDDGYQIIADKLQPILQAVLKK